MESEEKQHNLRYGFIYPIATSIVEAIRCLCVVELFKAIGKKFSTKETDVPRYASIGLDIFIVLKWVVILLFWLLEVRNFLATILVIYLLATNLFTYFYYHTWKPAFDSSRENLRRRFVNLILAIGFNLFSYSYLYALPFSGHFAVNSSLNISSSALFLSLSRSLFVDFPIMIPTDSIGHFLVILQTLTVFIFITIILATSIPGFDTDKK